MANISDVYVQLMNGTNILLDVSPRSPRRADEFTLSAA
jgi:hypothetical protein